MKLTFLGTGAAEGNPAMYCRCKYCQKIRKMGGKNLRARSAFRIDERHQIDLGPDTYWQMNTHGLDMYDIEHILITHTHSDHFQFEEIFAKSMSIGAETNGKILNIYMSLQAKEWLEKLSTAIYTQEMYEKKLHYFREHYRIHGLEYFKEYRIGDLVVKTLKTTHRPREADERAMNYLAQLQDGRWLLYALDTGWYPEETWAFLEGQKADILIMDCTFGGRTDRPEYPEGHLDMSSFVKMLQRMNVIHFISEQTQIFATHINPHQGLLHDELQEALDTIKFNVTLAYDGLTL